jgi:hypothetical protein
MAMRVMTVVEPGLCERWRTAAGALPPRRVVDSVDGDGGAEVRVRGLEGLVTGACRGGRRGCRWTDGGLVMRLGGKPAVTSPQLWVAHGW